MPSLCLRSEVNTAHIFKLTDAENERGTNLSRADSFRWSPRWPMGGKNIRAITDFDRAGFDVEVVCRWGHRRVLPRRLVIAWFVVKGWPLGLEVAGSAFAAAAAGRKAVRVGPAMR